MLLQLPQMEQAEVMARYNGLVHEKTNVNQGRCRMRLLSVVRHARGKRYNDTINEDYNVISGIGGQDLATKGNWDGAMSSTAKSTSFAAWCLITIFPMQTNTRTSIKLISKNMKEQSMFCREDSPANLFQSQGEEEERRMTAISGRRCLEQSPKSSQITYLVRMLVESSRWYHPLMMLRWVAKPIYSEKVTRYTKNMADSLPTSSVQTLSEKVTPSKSLLYQLVPSVRHTEGIGFGFLPNGLLPTPRANKVTDVNLANQRIADRDKGNLEEVIAKYVMTGNGLLPTPQPDIILKTPCAMDAGGYTRKSRSISGTSGTLAQEIFSGYAESESD